MHKAYSNQIYLNKLSKFLRSSLSISTNKFLAYATLASVILGFSFNTQAKDVEFAEQCPLPIQRCLTFIPDGVAEGNLYQISTDTAFAPFSSLSENPQDGVEGFDIDLLKLIAKDQSFAFRICADEFDKSMNKAFAGQSDGVMAGVSYSPTRAKKLDYSKAYYETHLAIVVHDLSDISKLEELTNKTVVVKIGTLAQELAHKYAKKYNLNVVECKSSFETFTAVNMGMGDFMLEDLPVVEYQLGSGLYPGLVILDDYFDLESGTEKYHFVVPKGKNQDLLNKFNQGLANIKSNGEYNKLVNSYFSNKDYANPVLSVKD